MSRKFAKLANRRKIRCILAVIIETLRPTFIFATAGKLAAPIF